MFSQPYGSVYNALVEVTYAPLSSKLNFVKRRQLYREPTTPKLAGLAARWPCPDNLAGVSAGVIIGQGILYKWTTLKGRLYRFVSYSIHKYPELDLRHIYEREYVLFGINYPILLTNLKKKKKEATKSVPLYIIIAAAAPRIRARLALILPALPVTGTSLAVLPLLEEEPAATGVVLGVAGT